MSAQDAARTLAAKATAMQAIAALGRAPLYSPEWLPTPSGLCFVLRRRCLAGDGCLSTPSSPFLREPSIWHNEWCPSKCTTDGCAVQLVAAVVVPRPALASPSASPPSVPAGGVAATSRYKLGLT